MTSKRFNFHYVCPWCGNGEVLADGKGKVTLSIQCPRCRRFFIADLDRQKTEKAAAQKRVSRSR